jgi:hypothetical protein
MLQSYTAGSEPTPASVSSPSASDVPSTVSASPSGVAEVASQISAGVGNVQQVFAEGTKGTVYVFEEVHTSRVGQIEEAIMLLHLHDSFGVKEIALEGAPISRHPLNARWFDSLGGPGSRGLREDIAVRMLAEGEISSAEFMTLLFSDTQVRGIEDAKLYARDANVTEKAEGAYLTLIAMKNAEQDMSQDDVRHVNQLMKEGRKEEAVEFVINADPWTKVQYDSLKAEAVSTTPKLSCEGLLDRLRGLQAKAAELGLPVDQQIQKMAASEVDIDQTCINRSKVMVAETSRMATGNKSIAMIIGEAHASGVTQSLRDNGIAFALVSPIAFQPTYGELSLEQFKRKDHLEWVQTSRGSLGALLDPPAKNTKHKPPPIIGTATARSFASALFAAEKVSATVRGGGRIPGDVLNELKTLPEFRADPHSFSVSGHDVIFKATLKDTDGHDRVVWIRAGSVASSRQLSLQQKLLQARVDLGGFGNIPPSQPPPNSRPAKDEGPGDGERDTGQNKKILIEKTGASSLAIFAANKSDIFSVGEISD